jgi:hypothetical protein
MAELRPGRRVPDLLAARSSCEVENLTKPMPRETYSCRCRQVYPGAFPGRRTARLQARPFAANAAESGAGH